MVQFCAYSLFKISTFGNPVLFSPTDSIAKLAFTFDRKSSLDEVLEPWCEIFKTSLLRFSPYSLISVSSIFDVASPVNKNFFPFAVSIITAL